MAELHPNATLVVQRVDALEQDPESIMGPFDPLRAPVVRSQNGTQVQFATRDRSSVQRFRIAAALTESYIGPYADMSTTDDANFTKARLQKTKFKFGVEFNKKWNLPHRTKVLLKRQFTFIDSLMRQEEGLPVGLELRDNHAQQPHNPGYTLRPFVFPKPGAPNDGVMMYLVTDPAFEHVSGNLDTTKNVIHTDDDDVDPNDEEVTEDTDSNSLERWPDPLNKLYLVPSLAEFTVNTDIQVFDIDSNWVHPRDYRTIFPVGTWVIADIYCCVWDYSNPSSNKDNSSPSKTFHCRLLRLQAIAPPLPDADTSTSYETPSKKRKSDAGGLPLPKPRALLQPVPSTSSSVKGPSQSTTETPTAAGPSLPKKIKISNKPAMSTGRKRPNPASSKGKEKEATSEATAPANAEINEQEDENMILDN